LQQQHRCPTIASAQQAANGKALRQNKKIKLHLFEEKTEGMFAQIQGAGLGSLYADTQGVK